MGMAFIALAALEAAAVTTAGNCTQKKTLAGIVRPLQKHPVKLNIERTRLCKGRGCKSFHPEILIARKITEAPGSVFIHCCSSSKVGPQITNRDTTTHLQLSWLLPCNTLLR
jgi:hypothetical protein